MSSIARPTDAAVGEARVSLRDLAWMATRTLWTMALGSRSTWILTFAGWLLFTASAAFFTVGAVRNGDAIELAASLTFLLACGLFLVPVIANRPGGS